MQEDKSVNLTSAQLTPESLSQVTGEARLHRAVRALAAQTGTPADQIIEWLCNGGLAQMALSYFASPSGGPAEVDCSLYLGHYATAEDGVTVTTHDAEPPFDTREQMTDAWLEDRFRRALALGGCAPDEPAANVLRGFANRVLQEFGDREGMCDALNVAYTRSQPMQIRQPSGE